LGGAVGSALGSLFTKGVTSIFGSVAGGGLSAVGGLASAATGSMGSGMRVGAGEDW